VDGYPRSGASQARRPLVRAILRTLLTPTVLFLLYVLLPLHREFTVGTVAGLGACVVAMALLVALQVRAILRSPHPAFRAVEAIALSLPLFLLLFAVTYTVLSGSYPNAFTEPLSKGDSLYFVVTVFATVGFGDIAPKTELARVVTTIQMLLGVIVVGLIAKIFLSAVQVAVRRRGEISASAAGLPAVDGAEAPSPTGGERSGLGSGG
jgi:voltage-gated potassium channel